MTTTKYAVGQRLVRRNANDHDGLVNAATVVEVTDTTVTLQWGGCGWWNDYDLIDTEDAAVLSDMVPVTA